MSVILDLQCQISSPADFDEVRDLWEDMRAHYDIYHSKRDYLVSIKNDASGGYVALGVRVERKDWRVAFSRPDTQESNDDKE